MKEVYAKNQTGQEVPLDPRMVPEALMHVDQAPWEKIVFQESGSVQQVKAQPNQRTLSYAPEYYPDPNSTQIITPNVPE